MRRSVVLAVLLVLGAPAQAATRCDAQPPRGPVGLPDSVLVKGTCGTFALRPSGIIERTEPLEWTPPWARDAHARAGNGTYIAHRQGHLVLLRDGRAFWRSRLAHGSDDVVVHGGGIAFSAYRRQYPDLWVAHIGGFEHLAGRGEDLDGWAAAGGFFTQRGIDLRLRAPDGRLVRHLEFVRSISYDRAGGTIFAITTSDLLVRTDGRRRTILADLAKFGLADQPWLELLPSGLVKVGSDNRVLLLRPDGQRFASAALARGSRKRAGAIVVSSFLTLPRLRGVVFVAQRGRGTGLTAIDRVLLLERGHRVPRVLYEARARTGCGYWANISLRGNDVLYWPSTGRALVDLDTSGLRAPLDLWPTVHRIPGLRDHARIHRAAWASAWND